MGPTHEQTRRGQPVAGRPPRRVARPTPAGLDPRQVFTALPAAVVGRAGRPIARRPPPEAAPAGRVAGRTRSPSRPAPSCATWPARRDAVGRAAGDLLGPPAGGADTAARDLGPRPADRGLRRRRRPAPSELRRTRVRTLLALLVVHGTLTRDAAIELLWPDHDAAGGARNLRVTLTYLRQLLEPERPAGEASFHLRADANAITLHRSGLPRRRPVGAAPAAPRRRPQPRARRHRPHDRPARRGHGLWRGEPLTDWPPSSDQEHEIERVRARPARQPPRAAASSASCGARPPAPWSTPSGRSPSTRTRSGPTGWPSPPPSARHDQHAHRRRHRAGARHARRARRRARAGHADPAPPRRACARG